MPGSCQIRLLRPQFYVLPPSLFRTFLPRLPAAPPSPPPPSNSREAIIFDIPGTPACLASCSRLQPGQPSQLGQNQSGIVGTVGAEFTGTFPMIGGIAKSLPGKNPVKFGGTFFTGKNPIWDIGGIEPRSEVFGQ